MMSLLACPFKDFRSVKQRFGDYPNNITAFSAIDACLIVIAAQGEDTWEGTYVTGIRSSLTGSAIRREWRFLLDSPGWISCHPQR